MSWEKSLKTADDIRKIHKNNILKANQELINECLADVLPLIQEATSEMEQSTLLEKKYVYFIKWDENIEYDKYINNVNAFKLIMEYLGFIINLKMYNKHGYNPSKRDITCFTIKW